MRSMGVALGSCTLPTVGGLPFPSQMMKWKLVWVSTERQAYNAVNLKTLIRLQRLWLIMWQRIYLLEGDEVAVLVNSLGDIPLEKLYILYREMNRLLTERGIQIYRPYVGRYACSMEMPGASSPL